MHYQIQKKPEIVSLLRRTTRCSKNSCPYVFFFWCPRKFLLWWLVPDLQNLNIFNEYNSTNFSSGHVNGSKIHSLYWVFIYYLPSCKFDLKNMLNVSCINVCIRKFIKYKYSILNFINLFLLWIICEQMRNFFMVRSDQTGPIRGDQEVYLGKRASIEITCKSKIFT